MYISKTDPVGSVQQGDRVYEVAGNKVPHCIRPKSTAKAAGVKVSSAVLAFRRLQHDTNDKLVHWVAMKLHRWYFFPPYMSVMSST